MQLRIFTIWASYPQEKAEQRLAGQLVMNNGPSNSTIHIASNLFRINPGKDGITDRILRAGGRPVLKDLQKLPNSVAVEGAIPEAWSKEWCYCSSKKKISTF
ncbi:hypothetical protein EVAR_52280_1 [Eumeta japonica]|uniref:Uncharacterized protein n=1 Tax=Eumeta variegata TaxID=151549 RepID=A0A4C1YUC7_EUMVA|nr:hypothetical protein EVAR_52280_1 [Eumeta japonica]